MTLPQSVSVYYDYGTKRDGSEKYLLRCIETLLRAHYDVTIIAQKASFDKDAVLRYFGVNIDNAKAHLVDGDLEEVCKEAERISRNFDICFYMTDYRFFNSRARRTFVVLEVPYGTITPLTILTKMLRGNVKESAKEYYRRQLFKKLKQTQAVIVYSQFVHDSLKEIHDIPSTILEPAIDDFEAKDAVKERVILSVGGFFRGPCHDKRYDVLIEAFKRLAKRLPNTSWQYELVGRCGTDDASQRYLRELRKSAKGFPIYFHINIPYEELKRHYNEASLFWHAAGFGVDEKRAPQHAEHFGMSTVEAMSAECVPVVINKGGQKEIVSHGESGYLWHTVDELIEYSMQLMTNRDLLTNMQVQARARFKQFDRQHFSDRIVSLFQPFS